MSKEKPDAFIAWHPKWGISGFLWAGDYTDGDNLDIKRATNIFVTRWENGESELADGWKIRPVKLTFLDELADINNEEQK